MLFLSTLIFDPIDDDTSKKGHKRRGSCVKEQKLINLGFNWVGYGLSLVELGGASSQSGYGVADPARFVVGGGPLRVC